MIGKTISHYKIIDKVGEGGMGVVYKAEDVKLRRLVALKFLPPHISGNPEEKTRFLHEAQSASALNHPHITTIHGIEETPEGVFIVMEYVEGGTLKQAVEKESSSLKKILEIGIQVCEGLAAAHKKEMVHRDIKSDNIMLNKEGQVKIMDFGLAKLKGVAKLTKAETTLGTAAYMSPEQASGEEVDQRSDIFSLGVVLYELLTGQLPFKGEHQAAIIYSICNEEPEPLARYKSGVPEELQRIVKKTLAKDRQERFQHVDDLLADLKRLKRELEETKEVPKKDKKGVAVLYFENLSSEPESDYFSAGITEDILTDLSKIESIRVASRNAVLPYKGKAVDIPLLGKKLNVDAVLEGSVRKAGNRIRISAQLIDTQEGFHLWAERYDRELKEVFDLQEEIAKKIAAALKIKLSNKEEEKIAQKYKGNLHAYDYYLKGRNNYYQYTKSGLQAALQMFKKALEIDPNYALAYAGLADSYYQFIDKGYESDKSFLQRAEEAAQKALSLDPLCAEAYKALGTIYYRIGKYNSSVKLLTKALEIDPNYDPARTNLALAYLNLGNSEQAEKELLFVYEQEPNFPYTSFMLAELYLMLNKFTQAEEFARKILDLGESSFYLTVGHLLLADIYLYQKQPEKALKYGEKCVEIEPDSPLSFVELASIYAALGEKEKSLEKLEEAFRHTIEQEWIISRVILTYALLQDKEKVYSWINKGMAENKAEWVVLQYNPLLEELRQEPKFQKLLQEIKNKIINSE